MPEFGFRRKSLNVLCDYWPTGDPQQNLLLEQESCEIRTRFRQDIGRNIHDGREFVFLGLGSELETAMGLLPPADGNVVYRTAQNCVYSQYMNHLWYYGRSKTLYLFVQT